MLSSLWKNKNCQVKGTQHQLPMFCKNFENFFCISYIFCFQHHIGVKIYDKQQILLNMPKLLK